MAINAVVENLDGLDDGIKSLYKQSEDGKFRLDVVGGEDVSVLKGALDKEREARKALEKAQKDGSGETETLKAKLREAEDAILKAEGNTQALAAKQVERMKEDFEKREAGALASKEAAELRAKSFESKVFENSIRASASVLHPSAVEDAILNAKSVFSLGDDGELVAKDKDGNLIYGKDGKTPLSPKEWLESLKEDKPHWFPAQGGSGTKGGTYVGGGKRSSMNIDQKAEFISKHGRDAYLKLPD
jgi:hypothetical protein